MITIGWSLVFEDKLTLFDHSMFGFNIKDKPKIIGQMYKSLFIVVTYSAHVSNKNRTIGC